MQKEGKGGIDIAQLNIEIPDEMANALRLIKGRNKTVKGFVIDAIKKALKELHEDIERKKAQKFGKSHNSAKCDQ